MLGVPLAVLPLLIALPLCPLTAPLPPLSSGTDANPGVGLGARGNPSGSGSPGGLLGAIHPLAGNLGPNAMGPLLVSREWGASGQCIEYYDDPEPWGDGTPQGGDGHEDGDYVDPNADGGFQATAAVNAGHLTGAASGAASGVGGTGGACQNGEYQCSGKALNMCHCGADGQLQWIKLHDCPTSCQNDGAVPQCH